MYNIYSNIELVIKIEPKNSTTNTANYKKLSNWSGSVNGNVTTTGLNGNGSAYGIYDMGGQVYEWTDSCPSSSLGVPYSSLFKSGASSDNQNIKILRGGSFADDNHNNLSKSYSKNFDILSMIDYGCMGFRVANNEPTSSSRPLDADSDYTLISNTGNSPDDCEYGLDAKLGQVNYLYNIQNQLMTNNEYCTYLNTIDPSGNKEFQIYDDRMSSSAVGGIEYNGCANIGSMYYLKDNFSNKPVTFVKWVMAAQYCNWLTNNKSSNILSITSGSYDIASLYNNSISISGYYRQDTAKYFLPSENEWYKAAYYDASNGKYWNYPTQSDEPPTAIICDAQGNRVSSENQSETEKIIPIVFVGDNIIDESNSQDVKYLIENSIDSNSYNRYNETLSKNYCPSVSIQANYITANNSSGIYIVPLVASMSNLNIGQKYSYNFSSAGSNWPSRIYPLSGSFTASSDEFQLPAILKLKPNDIYETTSFNTNLEYNHLEQDELRIYKDINIYNNIRINLMTDNCSDCSDNVRVVVDQNTLPTISQLDKAGVYFQSSSLSKNAINISGGLCDQYVPLIMNVSNPEPGKIYSFILSSNENDVIFMPNSGRVSFGGASGNLNRITSLFALNDNTSAIVKVNLSRIDIPYSVSDYIAVKCLDSCDNADQNNANYNNRAMWGYCVTDCPGKAPELRRFASVTRVGTNGGPSSYGTYDQDGNVLELCYLSNNIAQTGYIYRGGSFNSTIVGKYARFIFDTDTTSQYDDYIGFRVGSYTNPYNFSGLIPITDIGSPPTGNNPDQDTSFGSVNYSYQIGRYPTTNYEYSEFLNNTATTGYNGNVNQSASAGLWVYSPLMSGCYGGIDRVGSGTLSVPFSYSVQTNMSLKPVRFIDRKMAARYTNWLHNNKQSGWKYQQSGVYSFTANTNDFAASGWIRSSCALYFIPDENEWYKSAYYAGTNSNNTTSNYWTYATQSNALPGWVTATDTGAGIIPN